MSIASRLLGVMLIVGLLGWGIISSAGDSAGVFLNIPSLLLLLGVTLGGMLLSFDLVQIGRAFAAPFRRAGEPDAHQLATHLTVLSRARCLAWVGGFLSLLIGIVVMFKNLDDPNKFGPGLAVASMPVLYGVVLAELIIAPFRYALLTRKPPATSFPTLGKL